MTGPGGGGPGGGGMDELAATFRQQQKQLARLEAQILARIAAKPPSRALDSIPGRRIYYTLVGSQLFDIDQQNTRGSSINMLVSQDGPFVQTHYPIVMWKPTLPASATRFGRWRSVYHGPLNTQQETREYISISYEITDGGSSRNFQNNAMPPLISTVEDMKKLPIPTLFVPNTTIQFTPTYEDIEFTVNGTDTTEGSLVVAIPGYRIVSL